MAEVEPSPEFIAALESAWHLAIDPDVTHDDAVIFMAQGAVPIFGAVAATKEQAAAAGCASCTYLGLWAEHWPGVPDFPHGAIWIFEQGVRRLNGPLDQVIYEIITHECSHALQRDHVLDALEEARAAGWSASDPSVIGAQVAGQTAGCGCPGGH